MNSLIARRLVIILVIPYVLFLFEFITKDVSLRNVIKVIAAVFAPVPIGVFLAYIFTASQNYLIQSAYQVSINPIRAFVYLGHAIFVSIGIFYILEVYFYPKITQTVAPIFFNAFVLMVYVINIIYLKNLSLIAILSGFSIGISTYVLFK